MGFKKLRGVDLPEEKQGLIRYTCLTVQEQPLSVQNKIRRLCGECGGEYSAALWDVMCSNRNIVEIAQRHFVSERILYDLRKAFYEAW